MKYHHIMKNPKYFQLYATSYSKELGRIDQGMPGKAEDTNAIYFIDKADIPAELWKDVTYVCIVVAYRPEKPIHTEPDSLSEATSLPTPATAAP